MGTSYLGGLAIYTLRIPERFFPGKFDIIVIIFSLSKLHRDIAIKSGIYVFVSVFFFHTLVQWIIFMIEERLFALFDIIY